MSEVERERREYHRKLDEAEKEADKVYKSKIKKNRDEYVLEQYRIEHLEKMLDGLDPMSEQFSSIVHLIISCRERIDTLGKESQRLLQKRNALVNNLI